jgi:hypothetical protein
VSLLEDYRARPGYQPPPVDDIEDEDDDLEARFEVEKIISHKVRNGRRLYKVRWTGWSPDWDSDSKSERDLSGAEDVLEKYCRDAGIDRALSVDAADAGRAKSGPSRPHLINDRGKRKRGRPRTRR